MDSRGERGQVLPRVRGTERAHGARPDPAADMELLAGVRRNELTGLRNFVLRFEPVLMDQARRLGVAQDERRTVVTEFLDDMLVRLAGEKTEAPRSLTAFVITSFRNCVTDLRREAAVRARHSQSQEEMIGTEHVVRATCSEFMLRSARGDGCGDDSGEESPSYAAVMFARALIESCSYDERQLLIWSAHRVALRDCAAWLGLSYDAAKQKLFRLRVRLVRDSVARLSALAGPDRAALARILRRAGVQIDNDVTRSTA